MALSPTFERVSWIPLAFWIAAQVYVSSFEGWGQWAAAPILIAPLVASMILGIVGTGAYLGLPRSEKGSLRSIGVFLLPWIPILHVLSQNLWRAIT